MEELTQKAVHTIYQDTKNTFLTLLYLSPNISSACSNTINTALGLCEENNGRDL